jgi:hypothetical protein
MRTCPMVFRVKRYGPEPVHLEVPRFSRDDLVTDQADPLSLALGV